jgi:hypothetical protein
MVDSRRQAHQRLGGRLVESDLRALAAWPFLVILVFWLAALFVSFGQLAAQLDYR